MTRDSVKTDVARSPLLAPPQNMPLYTMGGSSFHPPPGQQGSVGQSIFCMSSAAPLEKPFAVGGCCFKQQSLPNSSGNANLLMDNSDTRGTLRNTFTVAGRN